MALLHLEPEDRYRLARYFDPPMYFLVVGAVLSTWLMGFAVMFKSARSSISESVSALPLPPNLVGVLEVTRLVPMALFFGTAAATLVVFFVLHERNRPNALGSEQRTATAEQVRLMIRDGLFGPDGKSPDEVAAMVLDGIRKDRFWIITHASARPALEARFAAILADIPAE